MPVTVDRPVYITVKEDEPQQQYVGIGLSLERADGVSPISSPALELLVRMSVMGCTNDQAVLPPFAGSCYICRAYHSWILGGTKRPNPGSKLRLHLDSGLTQEQLTVYWGQVGDEVVSINDIDVRELSVGTMKQLTVGPVGSHVKLDLLRASLPYTVFLERLLPTHTTYENAAAAGVLVHSAGGYVGGSVPNGQSVRAGPVYADRAAAWSASARFSGDWSGGVRTPGPIPA
jgi:hypothetical protein